jgi:hypothetical protein
MVKQLTTGKKRRQNVDDTTSIENRIYTPGDPLAYSTSIHNIEQQTAGAGRKKELKNFLQKQLYYRKHRALRPPKRTAALRVLSLGQNFFMDTFQVSQMANQNNRVKYILVFVDGFSRLLSCALLKSKNVVETGRGLTHILTQLQRNNLLAFNSVIGCDQDSTYFSKDITHMLETKFAAHCYRLRAPKKAFLAELYGKLIMQLIYKHMTATGTRQYIDVFDKLVLTLNKKKMKQLGGMAPIEINVGNQSVIQQINLNKQNALMLRKKQNRTKNLKVGDRVLLASPFRTFYKTHRGRYDPNIIYIISDVIDHQTVTRYRLKDTVDGKHLLTTFYRSSLQVIKED